MPTPSIDPVAAPLLWLALIASEATRRCREEAARVRKVFSERIAFEEEHYPDEEPTLWLNRSYSYVPVSCSVTYEEVEDDKPFVAAPTVTLRATGDDAVSREVVFTVCKMGIVRISSKGWPDGAPRLSLGKDPTTLAEAYLWAQRLVDRALPPLFAVVDPKG